MVRITTGRGTGTRVVKSGKSKSRKGKPSMRSGRGTVSRSSTGTYRKPTAKKNSKYKIRKGLR